MTLLEAIEAGLRDCKVYEDDVSWMARIILKHVNQCIQESKGKAETIIEDVEKALKAQEKVHQQMEEDFQRAWNKWEKRR